MGRIRLIQRIKCSGLTSGFILLFCILGGVNTLAQDFDLSAFSGEEYQETLGLFTDRSTYIAGEEILFTVLNLSGEALKNPQWSEIVYIELLTLDNQPVIQQKFRLAADGVHGSIELGKSPASGYYYLRAYTRWMRNYPSENYSSRRIRIINPYNQELAGNANGVDNRNYKVAKSSDSVLPVQIQADKKNYQIREKVSLSGDFPEVVGGLCLTVVRKAALDSNDQLEFMSSENPDNGAFYIPETRGMAISGKVVDIAGGKPVPNSRVQLSLIGEKPDYFGYLTGKDGDFYIAVPDYSGLKDFYISAETQAAGQIEILIDQDFSTQYIDPKQLTLQIGLEEKPFLEEMMLNAQVNNSYQAKTILSDSSLTEESVKEGNFYGDPWFTIRIDDYVKLPTLEEFIFELIPQTSIRRRGGKISLSMEGDYNDLSIYSPLILLDHVAISEVSAIINVSPEKLESIDLINASYVRGNIKYGGILSITSKNRDLAGIDLPLDSYFFNLITLTEVQETIFPDYSRGRGDLRNPDFRNCLFWDPDMHIDDQGQYKGEFFTSDRKGEYIIVVRGYTTEGQSIYGSTVINVD